MPLFSKGAGQYLAYTQVGLEMVAPIVLGLLLDFWLEWRPVGVIVGAVLGLVVGLTRLIRLNQLMNQKRQEDSPSPPPSSP